MRKDRSSSAAGLLEYSSSSSPDAVRKNKEKLTSQSSASKLRSNPHNTLVDLTIFHIPGMDVKLQYQSKVCTSPNNYMFGRTITANSNSFGVLHLKF